MTKPARNTICLWYERDAEEAARFVAAGWSLKWLHREIMLSATYRQSSGHDARKHALDPGNRWLWRMNRRRLEVEAWRDAVLAVSGSLEDRLGGPPSDLGDSKNRRRTIYGTIKRRELNDLLRLYDFPDPIAHSPGRTPKTMPKPSINCLPTRPIWVSPKRTSGSSWAIRGPTPTPKRPRARTF